MQGVRSDLFAIDRHEPLALVQRSAAAPPGFEGLDAIEFEFSSRGDRVPGHLILPPTHDPAPTVVLQHGLGGSRRSEYLQVAAKWAREGAAVATIDLPLHGDRSSPKMSMRLLSGIDRALSDPEDTEAIDPIARILWVESSRQAVHDLRRLVDALEHIERADSGRLVYVGLSLGGILGALFAAHDPRPRAFALAQAGGGFGPSEVDPVAYIGQVAPRELLLVNARSDERIPRARTDALFEAASEPRRQAWFDGSHAELPGVAFKEIWSFARAHLGL